jgi:hypothetical protein
MAIAFLVFRPTLGDVVAQREDLLSASSKPKADDRQHDAVDRALRVGHEKRRYPSTE